jgi:hypothetical protein
MKCKDCGKDLKHPDANLCLECCRKRWPESPNCPLKHDEDPDDSREEKE